MNLLTGSCREWQSKLFIQVSPLLLLILRSKLIIIAEYVGGRDNRDGHREWDLLIGCPKSRSGK